MAIKDPVRILRLRGMDGRSLFLKGVMLGGDYDIREFQILGRRPASDCFSNTTIGERKQYVSPRIRLTSC
jgi:hypothetical protein